MLQELHWPSLESRRLQRRLAMMYRIRFDHVNINWRQYLQKSSTHTRGHNSRFWMPFCSNQVYASSFFPKNHPGLEWAQDWPCRCSMSRRLQVSVEDVLYIIVLPWDHHFYLHHLYIWHHSNFGLRSFNSCTSPQPQCVYIHLVKSAYEGRKKGRAPWFRPSSY